MSEDIVDFRRLVDRQRMQGRFPGCTYAATCDAAIARGWYPAYYCQCHHGRSEDSPEFRHEAMRDLAARISSG